MVNPIIEFIKLKYAIPIAVVGFLPMKVNPQTVNKFLQPNSETKPLIWDTIQARQGRVNYFEQKLAEDKTDTITYFPSNWVCSDFARQLFINFDGLPELGNDSIKGLQDNEKHNIPMVYVTVIPEQGYAHAINAVLVGDDATNFYDWDFREPQTDWKVTPGMQSMPENSTITMKEMYVNESPSQGKYPASFPILEFNIVNGIPSEPTYIHGGLITERVPTRLENKLLHYEIKVYPNPVSDYLKIEGCKYGAIEVYDIAGRQLDKILLDGNEINMSNYRPGIYILKVLDLNGNIYIGKVIKK